MRHFPDFGPRRRTAAAAPPSVYTVYTQHGRNIPSTDIYGTSDMRMHMRLLVVGK